MNRTMGKKANTVFFIIGATLFNLIVTAACFFLFLLVYGYFFLSGSSENMLPWLIPIFFIASITISFFIYRLVVRIISKRINIDKHFAPLQNKYR